MSRERCKDIAGVYALSDGSVYASRPFTSFAACNYWQQIALGPKTVIFVDDPKARLSVLPPNSFYIRPGGYP